MVPQTIDYANPDEKIVKLYMRVRRPDENVLMTVKDNNGGLVAKFKKDTIAPGSMVALSVPIIKIADAATSLTIAVERQEG